MKIKAYTKPTPHDRDTIEVLNVTFKEEPERTIVQIKGPISYELDLFEDELTNGAIPEDICIDAGGRNFGLNQSVYIDNCYFLDIIRKYKASINKQKELQWK